MKKLQLKEETDLDLRLLSAVNLLLKSKNGEIYEETDIQYDDFSHRFLLGSGMQCGNEELGRQAVYRSDEKNGRKRDRPEQADVPQLGRHGRRIDVEGIPSCNLSDGNRAGAAAGAVRADAHGGLHA
ncbi:MAG TPA: hypothetical protein PL169_07900, partial [Leptospiraceae bacterium]|nr:hypothetical protein [Leptospiraceae bacterium]